MGQPRDSLIGLRGLDAFLEAAAVRQSAERSGDVLRVVGIAEAEKDLLFLVGVEVFARVEGVGVLEESWG